MSLVHPAPVAERNFRYLLPGLVAVLAIEPLIEATFGRTGERVLGYLLAALLLIGVWGLHASPRSLYVGRAIAGLTVVLSVADLVAHTPLLQVGMFVGAGAFFMLSVGIELRQILAPGRVTVGDLLGAAAVYLLLGLTWALSFSVIHYFDPAAFRGITSGRTSEFIYFSFVTLATLGYGDIVPVDALSRTVVYLEAIVGQLYVALLVATLVSRHVVSD